MNTLLLLNLVWHPHPLASAPTAMLQAAERLCRLLEASLACLQGCSVKR